MSVKEEEEEEEEKKRYTILVLDLDGPDFRVVPGGQGLNEAVLIGEGTLGRRKERKLQGAERKEKGRKKRQKEKATSRAL